jgi:transcriptional regulator with XRE-family HTH domain
VARNPAMRGGNLTIDRFVGMRIRERRMMLGLSQRELAESIGLATQQMIFKYEAGRNAVSAAILYEIAGVLRTSVAYFFEGLEEKAATELPLDQPMHLNLMRSLSEIKNEVHLEAIGRLIRALMSPDPSA